jgi:short subunit dehydrogenase-like uncharacterized protein
MPEGGGLGHALSLGDAGTVGPMSGRVILFGATGFTGRLTAEALTRAGMAPLLAGRHEGALVDLVGDLAGFGPVDAAPTWQRADVSEPESVRALVTSPDDVLVSTVGPFTRLGRPALNAALEAGCGYVDSTGEAPFIGTVFTDGHARALETGARLLTAFGYDYVPGNLAAALAIRDAAATASGPVQVEIGYFARGDLQMSSGTTATMATLVGTPPIALRNRRIVNVGSRVATFDVDGRRKDALAVGASEQYALPRLDDRVRDVDVYLGWFGSMSKVAGVASRVATTTMRIPVLGGAVRKGMAKAAGGTTGQGPSAQERASGRTVAVARTMDGVGREVSHVTVEGPSPYDLTAELLAWAAAMLLTRQESGAGALGPADAFGLDALVAGCADLGLQRVD